MEIKSPAARSGDKVCIVAYISGSDKEDVVGAINEVDFFEHRDSLDWSHQDKVQMLFYNIVKEDDDKVIEKIEADFDEFVKYYYNQLPEKDICARFASMRLNI